MVDPASQLRTIVVGDNSVAWSSAGFTVADAKVTIGATTIELAGGDGSRGIISAVVAGIDEPVDGLPFVSTSDDQLYDSAVVHANRVSHLDHLVVMTPDMDRTTDALTDAGLTLSRTRSFAIGAKPRRQSFFWLGDVILELVGDDEAHDPGPALFWGLALTCDDLGATSCELGEALGEPRDAVQPGRQIATLKTRDLDISIPIALMTPHPKQAR